MTAALNCNGMPTTLQAVCGPEHTVLTVSFPNGRLPVNQSDPNDFVASASRYCVRCQGQCQLQCPRDVPHGAQQCCKQASKHLFSTMWLERDCNRDSDTNFTTRAEPATHASLVMRMHAPSKARNTLRHRETMLSGACAYAWISECTAELLGCAFIYLKCSHPSRTGQHSACTHSCTRSMITHIYTLHTCACTSSHAVHTLE